MQARDLWTPVDPLGEALHFLRMSGTFYCRSELTEPWGLALPAMRDCLMFHFVISGGCRLEIDGTGSRRLQPGDLALVAHGAGHLLCSDPRDPSVDAAALFDLPRENVSERFEILRHGGGGQPTTLICGAVRFDDPAALQLVTLLPPVIAIDSASSPHPDWMQSTLRFMAAEAREMRPGGETVVTRLADILVIQAIRSWIADDPAAQTGWLGALQDKQIGRAIARIHKDPAHGWTLATLAAEAAMSRSAFAARFTSLVGVPAMQYVTQWRMHLALTALKKHDETLAGLANRVGYQSEAAFSRAFKRSVGVSPGSIHRNAAAPADRVL